MSRRLAGAFVAATSLASALALGVASPSSAASAPSCRSDQLVGTLKDSPAGAGTDIVRIHLHDSGRSCELKGHPTLITGIRPDGQHVELATRSMSAREYATYGRGKHPAVLSKHRLGEVTLAATQGCRAAQTHSRRAFDALVLHLGDHKTVRVRVIPEPEPSDRDISLPCKISMSSYSVVAAD